MKINRIKKIGFIGLGVMGMSMFRNLSKSNKYEVNGFDIDKEKMNRTDLKKSISIEEIFKKNDLIITCLPGGAQVEELFFKKKMINFVREKQIIVDMSTSQPQLMVKISNNIKNKDAFFVDAPIARTRQAAIDGTLAIMVGSQKEIFDIVKPVFELMGSDVMYCGNIGSGQFTKILNNMILFQNVLALTEACQIAENYDLNVEQLFQNISKCSGASFALKNHGLKSIVKNYYPKRAFSVEYAKKDLSYAIELAENKNITLRGCKNINDLFSNAIDEGYGDLYFPVIKKII